MILTIANLKGGSARTTTAMLLACAYAHLGHPVTVVDTDPRKNSTRWASRAAAAGDRLPFPVLAHPLPEPVLIHDPDQVTQLTHYDFPGVLTLLDTASATPQIVPATAEISDFVLVPFATSAGDYRPTLDALRSLAVPHAVVMTKVDGRTREEAELRQRFQADGVRVLETTIPRRAFLSRVYGTTPVNNLHGYADLARELTHLLPAVTERGTGQLLGG